MPTRKAVLYRTGSAFAKGTLPSLRRPLTRKEVRTMQELQPDDFVPRLDSVDESDPLGVLASDAAAQLPDKEWRD